MRKILAIAALTLAWAPAALSQQVVDRIVARVSNDVITESDLNELGRYQMLVDGKEQLEPERLKELVEQWMISHEASLSGFHPPGRQEVEKALASLEKRIGSPAEFEKRLKQLGLTEDQVKRMLERQMLLGRYLDQKFRPEVQVSEKAIEEYYDQTLVPGLKRAGQSVPPVDAVADKIRELLVEREISRRAAAWLEQMHEQWKVETIGRHGSP